jgi:isoaspartyl peptidase/L-asparaginase-like protein (Ntn-hydrolase superfamily)
MTGVGERILVLASAKRLADLLAGGRPLRDAAAATLAEIEGLGSYAGLIALDATGEVAVLRNTPFMATARRD